MWLTCDKAYDRNLDKPARPLCSTLQLPASEYNNTCLWMFLISPSHMSYQSIVTFCRIDRSQFIQTLAMTRAHMHARPISPISRIRLRNNHSTFSYTKGNIQTNLFIVISYSLECPPRWLLLHNDTTSLQNVWDSRCLECYICLRNRPPRTTSSSPLTS